MQMPWLRHRRLRQRAVALVHLRLLLLVGILFHRLAGTLVLAIVLRGNARIPLRGTLGLAAITHLPISVRSLPVGLQVPVEVVVMEAALRAAVVLPTLQAVVAVTLPLLRRGGMPALLTPVVQEAQILLRPDRIHSIRRSLGRRSPLLKLKL